MAGFPSPTPAKMRGATIFKSSTITRWARRRRTTAGLRAARPKGMEVRRARDRRRPVSGDRDRRRHRRPQSRLVSGTVAARRPDHRPDRQFDAGYELIDNDGPVLLFQNDKHAPRGRVIAVDTRRSGKPSGGRSFRKPPNAASRVAGRQPVFRQLSARRPFAGQGVRHRRRVSARSEVPGTGNRQRVQRYAGRRETFYSYHLVHVAGHDLSLRRGQRREHGVSAPKVGLRSRRLRDRAGLLRQQGRHAGADVHQLQEGT